MLSTGLMPQEGDRLFSTAAKKTLYPSPAAGGGRRLFLLLHVIVHVLSLVLLIAMLGEVGKKLDDSNIDGVHEALVFSMIFHIAGVVLILGVSGFVKKPFSYAILNTAMIWSFMASSALFITSLIGTHGILAIDHSARGLALVTLISISLGLSFVFSAFVSGLNASAISPEAAASLVSSTVAAQMSGGSMSDMQMKMSQGSGGY